MRSNRLGCLTSTGIIATLITAFAIAGFAFASGGQMFSPGHLNAAQGRMLGGISSHADIAGDCKACHAAPWEDATMDERCVVCHDNISAELADSTSIHGRLKVLDQTAQCRACHPEHNGSHASLTVLEEWKFPHQVTGYLLDGHQVKANNEQFLCADCHGADVTTFEPSTCEGCHDQIQMTFMVEHLVAFGGSCLGCHDGKDTFGKDFTHSKFAFSLMGSHALALCSQCHLGARSVADLKTTPQDCFACHADDPHDGTLGTNCASCHSPEYWNQVQFDHNRANFKLVGAHIEVACKSCHADNLFVSTPKDCFSCHQQDDQHDGRFGEDCATCHNPSTWKDWIFDHRLADFQLTGKHTDVKCESCHISGYRGTPKDCFSCHQKDDNHAGQFGTNCAKCHVTSSWSDVTFDHGDTGFALTGKHYNVNCTACHANGVYKGTATKCYACHATDDHHNGQFGTECSICHDTSGWGNVNFDHAATTGFALTGKHSKVSCQSCHANGVYKGTPTNCYACHASDDHHNGQFGKDCGACHDTSGWGNATFDHANTGFPLTGRHNGVTCQSCHSNGVYKGTPTNCYACHSSDDHHNGEFGTSCGSCHNPSGWGNVTFNHSNTAFPLTGRHSNVNCQSCHSNGVYKGTPKNCYACHASDDHHNGQFGTNCGSCHTPNGWGNVNFDHNNTAFPLVGKHTGVSCNSCHSNGVYQGTPTACYACHANDDAHNGKNGTDCGACHTPRSWGD